jgi:hypothetical protein
VPLSSLGDAESSLGDAESSLGDAESSLGDAKSSLGDVQVPVSIMEEEPPPAAPTRPSWFTNLPRQSVPSLSRPPPRASVVVQPATRSRRTSEEDEGPVPARSTSVGETPPVNFKDPFEIPVELKDRIEIPVGFLRTLLKSHFQGSRRARPSRARSCCRTGRTRRPHHPQQRRSSSLHARHCCRRRRHARRLPRCARRSLNQVGFHG